MINRKMEMYEDSQDGLGREELQYMRSMAVWSGATTGWPSTCSRPSPMRASRKRKTSRIETCKGCLFSDGKAVLDRWTEYCSELYNYPLTTDSNILQDTQETNIEPEDLQVLHAEVERVIFRA